MKKLPLYVRNNSIIIRGNIEQNAVDINKEYDINVYGNDGDIKYIYEDNGTTYEYESGKYNKIKVELSGGKLIITTENHGYKIDNKTRKLTVTHVVDKYKKASKSFEYELGTVREVKLSDLELETEEDRKQDLELFVDTMDRRYNGQVKMNILLVNNTKETRKYVLDIEKPVHYYVEGIPNRPVEKFEVNDYYHKQVLFKPLTDKMPQCEEVKVYIKDNDGNVVFERNVNVGNGYAKKWRVAVSKEHITDKDLFFDVSERENNAWGYVKLLSYLNIDAKGVCPVDFLDYSVKKGYAKGFVNIESDKDKEVYFRVKGETTIKVKVNGKTIIDTDDYAIDELVKTRLEQGENRVDVELTFESNHPYTGREFGFSIQVLNEDMEIDKDILFY